MSMFPIASATGTGGGGSFTFNSIPQTFTHLQLRIVGRNFTTSNAVFHYFNGDAAGTNYSVQTLFGNGSSPFNSVSQNRPYFEMDAVTQSTDTANVNGFMIIDVLDYANTSKLKTVRVFSGWDLNGSGRIYFQSGLWQSTAAINSWILTPGFSTSSRADLYGISTSTQTGV